MLLDCQLMILIHKFWLVFEMYNMEILIFMSFEKFFRLMSLIFLSCSITFLSLVFDVVVVTYELCELV